jgi:hypothetical protein
MRGRGVRRQGFDDGRGADGTEVLYSRVSYHLTVGPRILRLPS